MAIVPDQYANHFTVSIVGCYQT